MKLLVSFMPFKNFMSSKELNNLFSFFKGKSNIKINFIPFSDGGGSLNEVFEDKNTYTRTVQITNSLNRKDSCRVLINKKKKFGLFEINETMGQIKKKDIDPLKRSSFGIGQVILYLSKLNLNRIYIGTGGSINTDCGIGMAHALGVKFYDSKKKILNYKNTFFHARYLEKINDIKKIQLSKKLKKIKIFIISDSSVKLCGKKGQINIFSKQKKINKLDQIILTKSFKKMKKIFEKKSKKKFNLPYLGSGGGVASMLYFIFNSKLLNGAKFIFKKQKLDKYIKENDLIISGEGKLDRTTFEGKGLLEIIKASKKYKKKLYLICAKSTINKINYGNLINLDFKKITSKTNFIVRLKKKVNSIIKFNEKKN